MTDPTERTIAASPTPGKPPRRIAVLGCAVLETELEHFAEQLRDQQDVPEMIALTKLEQGLHNEPPRLRRELQAAIDRVEDESSPDAILLGYGLCSRGVDGLFARHATLVIPRAHDCITVLLGDRQRYADYVAKNPGTYWYSPGWNRHHTPPGKERYDKLYAKYVEDYGEDNAEFLMEQEQHWFTTYDRATYVHLTVGASDEDKRYTRKCADWLEWNYDEQAGDPQLLIDLLAGNWDAERFVVVPPGHRLKMTGDDDILASEPMADDERRDGGRRECEEVTS
ncbi:MAG: DUF1638 domain-containing protein [Phycisphaeraceae bacterium]